MEIERSSFIKNGVVRLPPGFRFHPTDEELVAQYLKRKAFSCPLPAAVIPEINLSKFDPWDLPGENEGDRYFFNLVERSTYHRSNRAAGSGYWKATGKPRPVVAPTRKELVGMKRVLVFHRWKSTRGSRRGLRRCDFDEEMAAAMVERGQQVAAFVVEKGQQGLLFEMKDDRAARVVMVEKRRVGEGKGGWKKKK
ncbi:NAC domain-containing protein 83-like [Zingiber officinale]|uniref:NAC domain-containing protein 83-like n=1 Tax=Zingiber officinale TaxID=94328 RepID=UPI001C4D94FF|nr:NAC domain-containing protein 83-like [Zingiber officinale]